MFCKNCGKEILENAAYCPEHEGIVNVIDCYSLKGRTIGEGDRILSVSEIKDPKNLNNFDFPNIWIVNEFYGGVPHPLGCDENTKYSE